MPCCTNGTYVPQHKPANTAYTSHNLLSMRAPLRFENAPGIIQSFSDQRLSYARHTDLSDSNHLATYSRRSAVNTGVSRLPHTAAAPLASPTATTPPS